MDDANQHFANAGIRFCWTGPIDYIDDDSFYFDIDTLAEIDALRSMNVVPGTVNVYFTPNLASESGPLCGISSFTWEPVQGIVMDNDCTATADDHSSFSHELGHYFDLLHTHETLFGQECVDGSNCASAGDLVCDTPADPQLGSANVDGACNYTGSSTDPCHNDPHSPDTRNLMSDSRPQCRNHYTAGQDGRAVATLLNLRSDHVTSDCPERWVQVRKLLAADGAAADFFGYLVAVSGDRIVVGAYLDDDNGTDSGSAYVFRDVNAPGPCLGDLNLDGTVDLSDLGTLLTNFGLGDGASPQMGDLDGDGDVDLVDLGLLLADFGTTCP